jgi:hypothetical protein
MQSVGSFGIYANVLTHHAQGIKNFGTLTATQDYNRRYRE